MAAYLRSQGPVNEAALAALSHHLAPALGTLTQTSSRAQELRVWLEMHALEVHLPLLTGSVQQLEDVVELTDADLEALGMPLAARRRFLRAAATVDEYLLGHRTAAVGGLGALWQRHLDALREQCPAALELLVLLHYLAPDDIDSSWLPELAKARGAGALYHHFHEQPAAASEQLAEDLLVMLATQPLVQLAQIKKKKKKGGKKGNLKVEERNKKGKNECKKLKVFAASYS